ncbi:PREDICTED: aspartate beta-hydroxylase domain-containing protein 1 [Bison bison bison]|uniref:Aspartate beta-hydroxylase domain-containing protein 1 n=1 Tax=Bison bison bison TaxID=43346 RepID=A0A6P3H1A4_BISBB|nr:PREDICTED: aspartate beta-hydroxylase domain-containing protein 1 [Bison bison bison]
MWRGSSAGGSQGAAMEGTGGELGGQGNWGLEDAPGLLARASLPIMPAWPLPLASSALTLLLGALTSLFLWYCYRLGSQDMQALGTGSRAGAVGGRPGGCSEAGRPSPGRSGESGEGPRTEGLMSRRLRAYARRYSWAGMGRVRRAAQGCPGAYRALRGLRSFMSANTFGNAGFSVLLPGARLEGRCGPTNARVRCHLGLKIPPGCELVVGGEPQCWAEGHCLLVDDSFLYTVAHNGSPEDGPRVVFIVDLWHPNVAGAERQALDFVFAPDP